MSQRDVYVVRVASAIEPYKQILNPVRSHRIREAQGQVVLNLNRRHVASHESHIMGIIRGQKGFLLLGS